MGLEPTRAYTHKILSLACLPIPALPLTSFGSLRKTRVIIASGSLKVNTFLNFFIFLIIPENSTQFSSAILLTPT